MNDLKLFKEDNLRYYKLAPGPWIDKVLNKNSTDIFVRVPPALLKNKSYRTVKS